MLFLLYHPAILCQFHHSLKCVVFNYHKNLMNLFFRVIPYSERHQHSPDRRLIPHMQSASEFHSMQFFYVFSALYSTPDKQITVHRQRGRIE